MLTPEFKKVKCLSFILLYVGSTEFYIQCMRIALLLFFLSAANFKEGSYMYVCI